MRKRDGDHECLDVAAGLLLRLARLLLASGADSEHARRRLEGAASRLGFSSQIFIGSERLLVMLGSAGVYRTRIGHELGALGVNVARLAALDRLSSSIEGGATGHRQIDEELSAIERLRSPYPAWLLVLSVSLSTAALAGLFGAGALEMCAALCAGAVSTVLRLLFSKIRMLPVAAVGSIAFISSAAGASASMALGVRPTLAIVAAGMILVPGVPLINGIRDLMYGHAAMGLSRVAGAGVMVLAIALGLCFSTSLLGLTIPVELATCALHLPLDFMLAAVASFGFAVLFNAPKESILGICVCGSVTHMSRTALMNCGLDASVSTFLGAMLAALVAARLAHSQRTPWIAFAFPSVVSMVPGSYAFRAMSGAMQIMAEGAASSVSLLGATVSATVSAVALTAAIGAGLLLATAVIDAIGRARRG